MLASTVARARANARPALSRRSSRFKLLHNIDCNRKPDSVRLFGFFVAAIGRGTLFTVCDRLLLVAYASERRDPSLSLGMMRIEVMRHFVPRSIDCAHPVRSARDDGNVTWQHRKAFFEKHTLHNPSQMPPSQIALSIRRYSVAKNLM